MGDPLKIVFCGLGSIGQRHAKLLLKHYNHELFAFRTRKGQRECHLPIQEIRTWNQFAEVDPDIAFITNPTSLHVEWAIQCAERNCSLFIEKPLGSKTDQIDTLIDIINSKGLSAYVAYNLRFHPIITEIKKYADGYEIQHIRARSISYLPNWKIAQDHRYNYSSHAEMGGGVIFDLSHEIDYVGYLAHGILSIDGQYSRTSDLTLDTEDVADLVIVGKSCIGNIHINFMGHHRERRICVDFRDFTLDGDLISGSIKRYEKEQLISVTDYDVDKDFTYRQQLAYFFNNLGAKMMNNIHEASDLFRKIIDFKNKHALP